ncbi:MAG TPA: hypothetical protein VF607_14565, partial [Verrucomicrobiae bacterium]
MKLNISRRWAGVAWMQAALAAVLFGTGASAAQSGGFEGEAGPHHRRTSTRSGVIEVASGMNYWDGSQWSPSEARFEMSPGGGFVAEKVLQKVRLKANLNHSGAVEVVAADGAIIKSTPVGIRLFDTESGEAMVIGTIKNCAGARAGENRVVYGDAFNGVCASVVYTITNGKFEQDVIITSNLHPEDYGFPSKSTQIQIMTEYFGVREPMRVMRPLYIEKDEAVRKQRAVPDVVDQTLDFGEVVIGPGSAYSGVLNAETEPTEAPVIKEFATIGKRTFLIESVEYNGIKAGLEKLPPCGEQTFRKPARASGQVLAALPPQPA